MGECQVVIKRSKELKGIIKAIENYCKKHNNNVCFIGSFTAFKGEGQHTEVIDDLMIGYGDTPTILICLEELTEEVDKEGDFINW